MFTIVSRFAALGLIVVLCTSGHANSVLPLSFQHDDTGTTLIARRGGERLAVDAEGLSFEADHNRVRLEWNASAAVRLQGEAELYRSHYFLGSKPQAWRTEVSQYAAAWVHDVQPGLDIRVYGNQNHELEFDLVLAPGVDPSRAELRLVDGPAPHLHDDGSLRFGDSGISLQAPFAYQLDAAGTPVEVAVRFVVDESHIGFALGDHDATAPLIVDPVIRSATLYGGGGTFESADAVALGPDGSVYVAGNTDAVDFPVIGALQSKSAGEFNDDAFLLKLNPDTGQVIWATYLGGTSFEGITDLAVDASGAVYVVGETFSADFPTTSGAAQPDRTGDSCCAAGFVAKVSAAGDELVYATYLDGSSADGATAVAVEPGGRAVVAGYSESVDLLAAPVIQDSLAGFRDAFVAVLSTNGSAIEFATYLGGSDWDTAGGVALLDGDIVIGGETGSDNFPLKAPLQAALAGGQFDQDAFVTRIALGENPEIVWSTYFGGVSFDEIRDLATATGDVFFAGNTFSGDFPVMNAALPNWTGTDDGFFTRIAGDGQSLVYSTYLGGVDFDEVSGLAVDASGVAHVVGEVYPSENVINFPQINASPLGPVGGFSDAFVVRYAADGSVDYSTRLGGLEFEGARAAATDAAGALWVVGSTASGASFPLLKPALLLPPGGFIDPFIVRIAPDAAGAELDLRLSQTVDNPVPLTGATVEFVITLDNPGAIPATGVEVFNQLPAGLTPVVSQPSRGTYDPATGLWSVGDVAPAGAETLLLQVTVDGSAEGAVVQHPAVISDLDQGDPNFTNNRAIASLAVGGATAFASDAGLAAAVLPITRSVRVGEPATAFAAVVPLAKPAIGCRLAPSTPVPAEFRFFRASGADNQIVGDANEPANVITDTDATANFVIVMTPTEAFAPTTVEFDFTCDNEAQPAVVVEGLNTLEISASADPVPDIIAAAATTQNDGIVRRFVDTGFFAVATTNVGAAGTITVRAEAPGVPVPLTLMLCRSDPLTGQCAADTELTSEPVTLDIGAGETPTFLISVQSNEFLVPDYALHRIFVRFDDQDGTSRGATSVAVDLW